MIYCSILLHSKRLPPVLFGQVAAAVPRGKTWQNCCVSKCRAFNNLVTVKTKKKTMCKTNVTCLHIYMCKCICISTCIWANQKKDWKDWKAARIAATWAFSGCCCIYKLGCVYESNWLMLGFLTTYHGWDALAGWKTMQKRIEMGNSSSNCLRLQVYSPRVCAWTSLPFLLWHWKSSREQSIQEMFCTFDMVFFRFLNMVLTRLKSGFLIPICFKYGFDMIIDIFLFESWERKLYQNRVEKLYRNGI